QVGEVRAREFEGLEGLRAVAMAKRLERLRLAMTGRRDVPEQRHIAQRRLGNWREVDEEMILNVARDRGDGGRRHDLRLIDPLARTQQDAATLADIADG